MFIKRAFFFFFWRERISEIRVELKGGVTRYRHISLSKQTFETRVANIPNFIYQGNMNVYTKHSLTLFYPRVH